MSTYNRFLVSVTFPPPHVICLPGCQVSTNRSQLFVNPFSTNLLGYNPTTAVHEIQVDMTRFSGLSWFPIAPTALIYVNVQGKVFTISQSLMVHFLVRSQTFEVYFYLTITAFGCNLRLRFWENRPSWCRLQKHVTFSLGLLTLNMILPWISF